MSAIAWVYTNTNVGAIPIDYIGVQTSIITCTAIGLDQTILSKSRGIDEIIRMG